MALYKPSELIARLKEIGTGPKKGLSQNFLIDGNIIRNIIKTAGIEKGAYVLEIGPGPGALTEALLDAGASVVAVEMDSKLAAFLPGLAKEGQFLKVISKDILKTPIEEILEAFPNKTKKVHLIANLPYHITTPVLTRFAPLFASFDEIVVMVQDEVARRFCAKPKTKEFGSITLFLQFYAELFYAFKVGGNCFMPPPKVDSAVVRLKLHAPPEGVDPERFFSLTRRAFGQRRKSLRASLKESVDSKSLLNALEKLKLSPLVRPEELSLQEWLLLFQALTHPSVEQKESP